MFGSGSSLAVGGLPAGALVAAVLVALLAYLDLAIAGRIERDVVVGLRAMSLSLVLVFALVALTRAV